MSLYNTGNQVDQDPGNLIYSTLERTSEWIFGETRSMTIHGLRGSNMLNWHQGSWTIPGTANFCSNA